jgi:hypothetical protein
MSEVSGRVGREDHESRCDGHDKTNQRSDGRRAKEAARRGVNDTLIEEPQIDDCDKTDGHGE